MTSKSIIQAKMKKKILKSLQNMPKNAQHNIGDLLEYAAQINHNNAITDHMANQGIHNIFLYHWINCIGI